jgi:hypothetical protein
MGRKITYERWIDLYLPDNWNEREDMGAIYLEKDGWPGLVQLSFIERDETARTPAEAAVVLLEDTLEERDIPFPREAVKVEERPGTGIATIDYTFRGTDEQVHWRIWFLVEKTRAVMAAFVCDTEHDTPCIDEASRIIADIEFLPPTTAA